MVAFELLTGRRPFERDSSPSEAAAHVNAPVPSASEASPALPPGVDAVFRRALAKSSEARFPTSAAFAAALRAACTGARHAPTRETALLAPDGRRSRRLAAGAAFVLLATAGAAVALLETVGKSPGRTAGSTSLSTPVRPATTRTSTSTSTRPTTTVAPPADASDLNTRGYELMLAGRYSAALPLLEHAVAGLANPADPVTAYANFNLGQTLVRLGQCTGALPYLERAATLEPTSSEAQAALGYARSCAGVSGPAGTASDRVPPGHGGPRHGHGNPHD